jgi:hypothetical protein
VGGAARAAAVLSAVSNLSPEERKRTTDATTKVINELQARIQQIRQIKPQTKETTAAIQENNKLITDQNHLLEVLSGSSQSVTDGVAEAFANVTHPYFTTCGQVWWTPDDPTRWEAKLSPVKANLLSIGRSVGVIWLAGLPIGTGFVVGRAPGTGYVITNRHVVERIADPVDKEKSQWQVKPLATIRFDVEWPLGPLLGCPSPNNERRYTINAVFAVAEDKDDDLGILITSEDSNFPPDLSPLVVHRENISYVGNMSIAVVGYPQDTRDMTQAEKEQAFRTPTNIVPQFGFRRINGGYTQNVKVSPLGEFAHDANTTGGNSGSPIVDLADGKIVGVHYCSLPRLQAAELPGHNFGLTSDRILKLLFQSNLILPPNLLSR